MDTQDSQSNAVTAENPALIRVAGMQAGILGEYHPNYSPTELELRINEHSAQRMRNPMFRFSTHPDTPVQSKPGAIIPAAPSRRKKYPCLILIVCRGKTKFE